MVNFHLLLSDGEGLDIDFKSCVLYCCQVKCGLCCTEMDELKASVSN